MIDYTMNIAKRDFMMGYLKRFQIVRVPPLTAGRDGCWHVQLGQGESHGYLVDARSKEPRLFKTLDAAVKASEEIGFKVITLESWT